MNTKKVDLSEVLDFYVVGTENEKGRWLTVRDLLSLKKICNGCLGSRKSLIKKIKIVK